MMVLYSLVVVVCRSPCSYVTHIRGILLFLHRTNECVHHPLQWHKRQDDSIYSSLCTVYMYVCRYFQRFCCQVHGCPSSPIMIPYLASHFLLSVWSSLLNSGLCLTSQLGNHGVLFVGLSLLLIHSASGIHSSLTRRSSISIKSSISFLTEGLSVHGLATPVECSTEEGWLLFLREERRCSVKALEEELEERFLPGFQPLLK